MTTCLICNKSKGKRFCAAFNGPICTYCCGSKRQKEIKCFLGCEFLKQGEAYKSAREISREINASFNTEKEDVFQFDDEAIAFVFPLEEFFVKNFYKNKEVNDDTIYDALSKIYSFQIGKTEFPKAESNPEKLIFERFIKLDEEFPNISAEIKKKSILRILKSIQLSSGGEMGNRNYLEMIYSQTNKNGRWYWMFHGK